MLCSNYCHLHAAVTTCHVAAIPALLDGLQGPCLLLAFPVASSSRIYRIADSYPLPPVVAILLQQRDFFSTVRFYEGKYRAAGETPAALGSLPVMRLSSAPRRQGHQAGGAYGQQQRPWRGGYTVPRIRRDRPGRNRRVERFRGRPRRQGRSRSAAGSRRAAGPR